MIAFLLMLLCSPFIVSIGVGVMLYHRHAN
jgi:hypothetical protein